LQLGRRPDCDPDGPGAATGKYNRTRNATLDLTGKPCGFYIAYQLGLGTVTRTA